MHWYYYNVFLEALTVLSCPGRSIFTACDCFGGSYFYHFFFFLVTGRMFVSDHVWRCIPVSVKPDLGELNSTLIAKV